MYKTGRFGLPGIALLLASASTACSQGITVTPAEPWVVAGQTVQYSARVTGLTGNGVTWYAAGVKGGSSKAGTISASGLYTAPSTPPAQNPVTIKAASVANTGISGSAYAYIIQYGPNITSVSPNQPSSVPPASLRPVTKGAPRAQLFV